MKCKNLKLKLNHTIYCKKMNKEIQLKYCNNCKYKEYKKQILVSSQNWKKTSKNDSIKKKSAKLSKLERNRFSLFTTDLEHCMICGSTYQLTWHEIFDGRNRSNSMRYGLCLRICLSCHRLKQNDANFNELWHKKGQAMFVKTYPDLDFVSIFKKNYL